MYVAFLEKVQVGLWFQNVVLVNPTALKEAVADHGLAKQKKSGDEGG